MHKGAPTKSRYWSRRVATQNSIAIDPHMAPIYRPSPTSLSYSAVSKTTEQAGSLQLQINFVFDFL